MRNSREGDRQAAALLRYQVRQGALQLESKRVYSSKEIVGLGCASPSNCAGIADRVTKTGPGSFIDHPLTVGTTNGGSRWRFGPDQAIPFGFWSTACPTTRVCVAASFGDSSVSERLLVRTGNRGRSWQLIHFSSRIPFVDTASCASIRFCVAVGGQNSDTNAWARFVLISHDAARTWQRVPVRR